MPRVEFEWALDTIDHENVFVIERVTGDDRFVRHGPMPPHLTDAFIRARRDYVARAMSGRALRILRN